MKFGKQLEEYEFPEWRGHYIPYKALKKLLEDIKVNSVSRTPDLATPRAAMRQTSRLILRGGVDDAESHAEAFDPAAEWHACLHREALRVGDFVDRGLAGLEAQLQDLSKMSQSLGGTRADSDAASGDEAYYLGLRVLEAIGRVAEGVQRLRGFAELNHAALYKILKKYDKRLGTATGSHTGLSEVFPRLVEATRLSETSRFDQLDADLRRLSQQSSQTEGLVASPEVIRLAVGLGLSKSVAAGEGFYASGATRIQLLLSFFLGSSSALFVSIGVLLWLPEKSPKTFSEAYFLTPMPVFRVIFSVLLSLWCMGAVARVCDKFDINFMFILGVDPRCRVSPEYYFSRAATLTTLWILIFGMYVVDYKWRVVPTVWSDEGYNKRASLHFVFYPVVLLAITILGIVWPSRICRNRYKASVVRSIRRTALAPVYPVDFADNIVGDVLTSLAKPLQDVPAAVCYLISSHPQEEELVMRFVEKGDTCHYRTHHVVLPIIAGLPYVFRAMQYVSSLLVVVVSSAQLFSWRFVALVSAVATVYAGIWDVTLDWGLGRHDFFGTAREPSGRLTTEADPVVTPNSKHVKPARVERPERQFPRRAYLLCILLDLLARSTWVLTLMPITTLTGNIVGRVVLVSIISSVEIVRRSMWAVLRIEYEQVANASGFRALLWVPSKLNASDRAPARSGSGTRQPLLA